MELRGGAHTGGCMGVAINPRLKGSFCQKQMERPELLAPTVATIHSQGHYPRVCFSLQPYCVIGMLVLALMQCCIDVRVTFNGTERQ